jgi:hypothetical protein
MHDCMHVITDRQKDRQTDRQTEGQPDRHDRLTIIGIEGQTANKQPASQPDSQTDRQAANQIDRPTHHG